MKTIQLEQLLPHERNVMGGLIRLMLRADGQFSSVEEAWLDALTEELCVGHEGRGALWHSVTVAAQTYPNAASVMADLDSVRGPSRVLILGVLASLAASDRVTPEERDLLAVVREAWKE